MISDHNYAFIHVEKTAGVFYLPGYYYALVNK